MVDKTHRAELGRQGVKHLLAEMRRRPIRPWTANPSSSLRSASSSAVSVALGGTWQPLGGKAADVVGPYDLLAESYSGATDDGTLSLYAYADLVRVRPRCN